MLEWRHLERKRHWMDATRIWVVIPAYNEETAIGRVLTGFSSSLYQVVVIDDGSSDATCQVCLGYPVTVLRHITNLGQGAAIQTGIDYALRQADMTHVVTFDSDGQHQVADIARMVNALEQAHAEVALGSRFIKGGKAVGIGAVKQAVLKLAIYFTRLTSGLKVSDTHNGLRVFTRNAARRIHIHQNRMAHASEILVEIAAQRIAYCEVPVNISYTAYSKVKGQSVWNSVNIVWDIFTRKIR